MVNPNVVDPERPVTSQDLAGMLGAAPPSTQTAPSASRPDGTEQPEADAGRAPHAQIANEVLIDKLMQKSYDLAASGAMYPYFEAGHLTTDFAALNGLNATYTGRADGAFAGGASVGGALTMNVDFAAMASFARVDAAINFDNSMGNANFELYQNASGSLYSETVTGVYGGENLGEGHLAGSFYGPSAEEVGGAWGITVGADSAVGTFNGKR